MLWYWILLFACGNFTYRYRAAARDFLADPILGPALIKEATNSMKKEIQHLSENREGSQMRAESAIVAGHYSFSTAMAECPIVALSNDWHCAKSKQVIKRTESSHCVVTLSKPLEFKKLCLTEVPWLVTVPVTCTCEGILL